MSEYSMQIQPKYIEIYTNTKLIFFEILKIIQSLYGRYVPRQIKNLKNVHLLKATGYCHHFLCYLGNNEWRLITQQYIAPYGAFYHALRGVKNALDTIQTIQVKQSPLWKTIDFLTRASN